MGTLYILLGFSFSGFFLRGLFVCLFVLATLHGTRDLSSPTGLEPGPPAVEAWSPNHWTAREFPAQFFYKPKATQKRKSIN